jgi:sirohydrochlorin cobaltochelatase
MSRELAVILAAHGAGDGSRANALVRRLARRVSARARLPVVVAFKLGRPGYADALAGTDARRVVVIPVMTSNGHFARWVVPRRFAEGRCLVCAPVGTSAAVIAALAARTARTVAREALEPAATTVVVVGHGTRRCGTSGDAARALARAIGDRVPGIGLRAAFLDQEPRLETVAPTINTPSVVVVPFLLGGGRHASTDITERLGLEDRPGSESVRAHEQGGRRYVLEPPLLEAPALLEAIVACIDARRRRAPVPSGARRPVNAGAGAPA